MRRRHDTLLRGYLVARGLPSTLERTLRDAYWMESVSNTLAGALHYHLLVAMDTHARSERERQAAAATARPIFASSGALTLCGARRDDARLPRELQALTSTLGIPHIAEVHQRATPAAPADHREGGGIGSEGLPARGRLTRQTAQGLADHARVCDDDNSPARVRTRDPLHGSQHPLPEMGVRLAARPGKVVVVLRQVGMPQPRILASNPRDRESIKVSTGDLAERWPGSRLDSELLRKRSGRVHRSAEGAGVDGLCRS